MRSEMISASFSEQIFDEIKKLPAKKAPENMDINIIRAYQTA